MQTFQWNALRAGDHVMVHDDSDPSLALRDGDVRIVQARNGAANGVVIRLRAPCEEFALKPSTVAARPRRLLAL